MQAMNLLTQSSLDPAAGTQLGPAAASPVADAREISAFVVAWLNQTEVVQAAVNAPEDAPQTTLPVAAITPVAGLNLPAARQSMAAEPGTAALADLATDDGLKLRPNEIKVGVTEKPILQPGNTPEFEADGETPQLTSARDGINADGERLERPLLPSNLNALVRGGHSEVPSARTGDLSAAISASATNVASEAVSQSANQAADTALQSPRMNTVQTSQAYTPADAAAALPVKDADLLSARLNQHVTVMLGQQIQNARIAVNPAELGPVEIRVSVVGDEANIQMSAAHAATREALEDALPRLRAAFGDSGISVGDASVSDQLGEQHSADANNEEANAEPGPTQGGLESSSVPLRRVAIGLVDAFV